MAATPCSTAEESLAELGRLSDTAGLEVVGQGGPGRQAVNPGTLIGSGKIEEVRQLASQLGGDVAIFDDELSPAQQRNLEKRARRQGDRPHAS